MKIDVPEVRHTPFVTVQRFCEMTGLTKSQARHMIKSGYLPTIRLTDGKQISKSHYVNLLKIQAKVSDASGEIVHLTA
ncbi:Cox family DNA-binding protein [Thiomicrorhabdus chilensis]|uniref:Cox family DNA-binding protein n=1 Tax=Thiomicrorhabdus chilensis TaxID=63656 RepID=UPI00048E84EE|nr:Cox family DNA-binding protein [Thiomicrorhabdus chilensis]